MQLPGDSPTGDFYDITFLYYTIFKIVSSLLSLHSLQTLPYTPDVALFFIRSLQQACSPALVDAHHV